VRTMPGELPRCGGPPRQVSKVRGLRLPGVPGIVSPPNVIQPLLFQAGMEALWSPVMDYHLGYCGYGCTLCTEVFCTGAIQELSVEEKLGQEPYPTPISPGTAFLDRTRCLPWAMYRPCVVCE